jgi:hypothetical protein
MLAAAAAAQKHLLVGLLGLEAVGLVLLELLILLLEVEQLTLAVAVAVEKIQLERLEQEAPALSF